jgi:glutaredoxin
VTVSALPGCDYCANAVALLQAHGYTVTELEPGDPGWVSNAASYPVIQYGAGVTPLPGA